MQYRKIVKNGEDVSVLGYGCLRFPVKNMQVLEKETKEQLLYAYNQGINYYDTAYLYHNGKSEVILGEFIKENGIRDKVYIADKLPTFLVKKPSEIASFFKTQLEKLDTTYIDYYLMHMLDSLHSWQTLKDYGIIEFIEEKKKTGEIKYIGFSFHGRQEEFLKIIEDYNWDFCQIQYNYLDEYNQAGVKGLKRAYELGIGVVIMEPLRGGNLANKAPIEVQKLFKEKNPNLSIAQWGLKWIFNQKEVGLILSGMNEIKQIDENVEVATNTLPNSMTDEEIKTIDEAKSIYQKVMKVPCTGCRYCMPCPFGVDIPATFSDYNDKYFFKTTMSTFQYITRVVGGSGYEKSGANLCRNCGKCLKHCPQEIKIPKELEQAHKKLDNKIMHFGIWIMYKFFKRKNKKQ